MLFVLITLFSSSAVKCEVIETIPDVSRVLHSGFSYEMIMTKLQIIEYNMLQLAKTTSEIRTSNYTSCNMLGSGIHQLQPEKPFKQPITVLCDQEYESGGWTVILNRFEGSVNFYRGWKEYEQGFGSLHDEFWLGLDRIHQLTASRPHELVILLEDYDGNKTYAKYQRFEIGDEAQKYALVKLSGYSGTAGDSMSDLVGMKFTTLDSDNDTWDKNCAVSFTGAWWYTACHRSNLNGKYLQGETKEFATGMVWQTFRGYHHALKAAKMMIRPAK